MSNMKSSSSNLVFVAVICTAMSLVVWLFLVLFYDELFAPSGGKAPRAKTAASSESSENSNAAPTLTSAPSSTASQPTGEGSNFSDSGSVTRLTKAPSWTVKSAPTEKTFFDVEENESSSGQQIVDGQQVVEETATERSTRLMRETLGISKRPPPTHALDVSLIGGGECVKPEEKTFLIPVMFSHNGSSVRGASIVDLNALLAVYRRCEQGYFKLSTVPSGQGDASESLTQMRLDELKYFFHQNGVPPDSLRFPANI